MFGPNYPRLRVIEVGPFMADVQAGPIFERNGNMALLALRDVKVGEVNSAVLDALIYPDFSRPIKGTTGAAGAFWHGNLDFYQ